MKPLPAAWLLLVLLVALSMPLAAALERELPRRSDPADLGLGRLTGGVLTGVLRPMLLSYLWIRADTLYGERRYDELRLHYRTLLRLYPRNERAREYFGWHLCFNMKGDAPSPEAAWQWAREGLDILAGTDRGKLTVALWYLLQCGPYASQRYAGPGWEAEKRLRARAREWCRERTGRELDRFQAARHWIEERLRQRVPPERRTLLDGLASYFHATVLEKEAFEEYARDGRSATQAEARAAMERLARGAPEEMPEVARILRERARLLGAVERAAAGAPPAELDRSKDTDVAAALWGIGRRLLREGRREEAVARLAQAKRIFSAFGDEVLVEERAQIDAWLAHARDPARPAPPGPFD
ncbi:MAG: hypothetical protein ACE5JG_07175 [Planctomycetota bacterium]